MALTTLETCLRQIVERSYTILDGGPAEAGDVIIRSQGSLVPRLGDRFTIETDGRARDLEVFALTILKGGWSANCRPHGL